MKKIKTIFVIEDDPISSFVIRLALKDHIAFHECQEFKNGQAAVDFLIQSQEKEKRPELILLDINMPIMDGWEFLEKFSALPYAADIPIIMLSSSINPKDIKKAKANQQVKGFFSKPINNEKLDEILMMVG